MTRWDDEFDLQFLSQHGSAQNCVGWSARVIHLNVVGTFSKQASTTTIYNPLLKSRFANPSETRVGSVVCHRLVGLVVKMSASRAEDPGFESHLRRDFSGSKHTSHLKTGTSVASLPRALRHKDSTGTGQPGVSILWLGEVESLTTNFCLVVAAHKIIWADPPRRTQACCWDVKQIRPGDTLACCWDVKQIRPWDTLAYCWELNNQPSNQQQPRVWPAGIPRVADSHCSRRLTFSCCCPRQHSCCSAFLPRLPDFAVVLYSTLAALYFYLVSLTLLLFSTALLLLCISTSSPWLCCCSLQHSCCSVFLPRLPLLSTTPYMGGLFLFFVSHLVCLSVGFCLHVRLLVYLPVSLSVNGSKSS